MDKIYTIKEAVGVLKISRANLYQRIARGEIKPLKMGKRTLFLEDELQGFIERLKALGPKGENVHPKQGPRGLAMPASEAIRYMENAKEILKGAPVEDNVYLDKKPVKEAFGTAYLAVLEALNEALLKKGLHRKELPKSVDGYLAAIKKHLAVNDGKLIRGFNSLYDALHIAGYYRGLIYEVSAVKDYLNAAERFINKLP